MSVNFIPGYDFSTHEEVTSQKLRLWIGGTHNSETLSGSDIGLVSFDIDSNPTWSSSITEGNLCYDISRGWISVYGRNGWTPLFGTQGALMTTRLPREVDPGIYGNYFYNPIKQRAFRAYDFYDSGKTLPVSSYSAGIGFDNFGIPLTYSAYRAHCSACMSDDGANDNIDMFFDNIGFYPNENNYLLTTGGTIASAASTGSLIYELYAIGGIQPRRINAAYDASHSNQSGIYNLAGTDEMSIYYAGGFVGSPYTPLQEICMRDQGLGQYFVYPSAKNTASLFF